MLFKAVALQFDSESCILNAHEFVSYHSEGNLLVDPIFGAEPRTAQTTVRFNPDGIDLYNSIKAKYKIGDTPETVVHANVVQTGQG